MVDPAHVTVELGNLFGGNEVLGELRTTDSSSKCSSKRDCEGTDNVSVSGYYGNKFINANWRAVLNQIREPLNEAFGLTVHRIFSEAAKTVPYKDFFDDTE